ncbi:MAG TPA: spore coat U domain-containing protein [Candidatus Tectomicrobia bacterium]
MTRKYAISTPSLRHFPICVALLAFAWIMAFPVHAGSATATLTVSVNVVSTCTLTSGTLRFGDDAALGGHPSGRLVATGTVLGSCRTGTLAMISLDQGTNAAAESTPMAPMRRLRNARGDFLSYNLYQDATLRTVWGDSTSSRIQHSESATAADFSIYGQLPAGREARAGSYSDTVVVTIIY